MTKVSVIIAFLLCVLITPCISKISPNQIDSAEHELSVMKDDTSKAKLLMYLGRAYWYTNPDTAILLCKGAIELADELEAAVIKGIAQRYCGVALTYLTRYDEALEYCGQSISTLESIPNYKEVAGTYTSIGIIRYYQGDFPKAIDNHLKSLALKEKVGDKKGVAVSLNNIGIIYWVQKELDQALKYYFRSQEMEEELIAEAKENGEQHDGNGLAVAYNNIGNIYSEKAQIAFNNSNTSALKENSFKAMEYYSLSLVLQEELDSKVDMASTIGNMSLIYNDLAKYELLQGNDEEKIKYYLIALEYQERSLEMRRELGDAKGIATTLLNIGQIQLALNYPVDQIVNDYGIPCYDLANETQTLGIMKYAAELMYRLYLAKNDYQGALRYYKEQQAIKDSLFNEDKSKELGRLEAGYEMEKQILENKRLADEKKARDLAEKARGDNLQYSGILIFLVLVFTAVFLLGKVSIPIRLAEGLIFFSFLLFFEFSLVLLDPFIEQYSGGEPAYKLLFNALLAGLIFPIHSFFENRLVKKLVKRT